MPIKSISFAICFCLISLSTAAAKAERHSVAAVSAIHAGAKKAPLYITDAHRLGELQSDYASISVEAVRIYQYGKSKPLYKGITLILTGSMVTLNVDEAKALSSTIPDLIKVGNEWADVQKESAEADIFVGDPYIFNIGFYQEGTKRVIYMSSLEATVMLKSLDDILSFKDLVDQGLIWLSHDKSADPSQNNKKDLVISVIKKRYHNKNGFRQNPGTRINTGADEQD